VVSAEFDKGEDAKVHLALAALRAAGVPAALKESVQPQTLKAFCAEMVESGNEFDGALFNLFIGSKTVIKQP